MRGVSKGIKLIAHQKPRTHGEAISRFAAGVVFLLLVFLNKSFDQTFSKVWPPAGSPKASLFSANKIQYFKLEFFFFNWYPY